jgi:hypothetical protein
MSAVTTKTFDGIDMDFVKAIAILITRIFALAVADRLMPIAPFGQARIDIYSSV